MKYSDFQVRADAGVAELIGTTLFLFAALAGATLTGGSLLGAALSFGAAVTVAAFATAPNGGGQLNPAVSTGLFLSGALGPVQTLANIVMQCIGQVLATGMVYLLLPHGDHGDVGVNKLAPDATARHAFVGEMMMTLMLVYLVLEGSLAERAGVTVPIAVGLAVFVGNVVMIPIDGASLNPAKQFGPALLANQWGDGWVWMIGPLVGACIAAFFFWVIRCVRELDEQRLSATPARASSMTAAAIQM